jgi:hypothetical protein
MDGVKLQIEKPGDDVRQSHFYDGLIHIMLQIFSSFPNGYICDAYMSSPETTHDSTMASYSKIYDKIDAFGIILMALRKL